MQVKKQHLEMDMEQQTDSKLGKEYVKAVYCQPAYLTYMQSSSNSVSCSVVSKYLRHQDCSLPGSSVHGILQVRIQDGLPFFSSGDLPNPGIEPVSPVSPALAGGVFTTSATRERKKVKSLSHVQLFASPWTVAYQAPLSMGFSRQ